MATNRISDGKTLNYTPSGSTVTSGSVVVVGGLLGVALTDIADGATGALAIEGVFDLPAVVGAEFVAGRGITWDVSANAGAGAADDHAATPATGDLTGQSVALETKTAGASDTVRVKLNVPPATIN